MVCFKFLINVVGLIFVQWQCNSRARAQSLAGEFWLDVIQCKQIFGHKLRVRNWSNSVLNLARCLLYVSINKIRSYFKTSSDVFYAHISSKMCFSLWGEIQSLFPHHVSWNQDKAWLSEEIFFDDKVNWKSRVSRMCRKINKVSSIVSSL